MRYFDRVFGKVSIFSSIMIFTVVAGPSQASAGPSENILSQIQRSIESNWARPVDLDASPDFTVTVKFHLDRKGEIEGQLNISASGAPPAMQRAAIASVRRSVLRAAPYKLPPEKYENWKDVEVVFHLGTENQ
ncbi:cell envelope integrity protein TolA [Phyllobacterium bourgognense]|uniref:TonB-like protein n=1 Tax=Phyllobacterium bourgognense TaxID=314236 RepID=A0A368YVU8_9HYPH|nr:cell envelope integrity protein TolA [Phyllobacterium bourgognense]RCW84321.1 TonB-like protein [Phyllobacterium bourgognense]